MDRVAAQLEYLDGPLEDARELDGSLRDLRRVNRWLGGFALSRPALVRLLGSMTPGVGDPLEPYRSQQRPLQLLDVGTGSADIPAALLEWAGRKGFRMEIVGIDERPEIIEVARQVFRDRDGLRLRVTPGDALPYPDGSFDVAHASLVTHHLTPDDALGLLREMARVSRLGVVVNDLDRGRLGWLGAVVLTRLFTRNRLTRHDGPLSVRRAYTPAELMRIAADAGLRPAARIDGFLRHRYALAFVHASGPGLPPNDAA